MLPEHAVKRSLLVFDDAVQDDPRQHREEIRLLGVVRGAHAKIDQLKRKTQSAKIPQCTTGRPAVCGPSPPDLDQVVCQSGHTGEVGDVSEQLRVFGEADLDAFQ